LPEGFDRIRPIFRHIMIETKLTPYEITKNWLAAINSHDVAALTRLMAENFLFVDSQGNRVEGAVPMEGGWRSYFQMCPDYWVRADSILIDGETAMICGEAGGTIDGEIWRTPAAWKAVFTDRRMAEWRVFADNKPVYEILSRRR
jgi:ketosteroid isomerase-like protein